ncbi:MAG: hypothetical protein HY040_09010 [Planctomycetes bacterium]|nr:hypothetical protein [Planctomycetota bacterium]
MTAKAKLCGEVDSSESEVVAHAGQAAQVATADNSAKPQSEESCISVEDSVGDGLDVVVANRPALTFIFGSARSGTTWLAKLIDSDPGVVYIHEPISKGHGLLLHDAISTLRSGKPLAPDGRVKIVNQLVAKCVRFSHTPYFPKSFTRFAHAQNLLWGLSKLMRLPASILVGPRPSQAAMVLVKDSLENFARPLVDALDARSIVLLRHPCGVVNSVLRGQKIGAMARISRPAFWKSARDFLERLGYHERDVNALREDEFAALTWLATNREVPSWSTDKRWKIVTYCSLVRQLPEVIDENFTWLGLRMSSQSQDYLGRSTRPGGSWLRALLGRKKMYYSVSRRSKRPEIAWKQEMPADSIRRVLKIVEPFPLARFWPDES